MTEETKDVGDQFPTLVYKGKGPHSRSGGTYDYTAANDQESFDDKLANGWFATMPEAIADQDKVVVSAPETESASSSSKPAAKVTSRSKE